MQLARRFSGAAVLAEQVEARLVEGKQIDLTEYNGLISSLVRIANRIGLNRIPKTVTPALRDYLVARPNGNDDDADGGEE